VLLPGQASLISKLNSLGDMYPSYDKGMRSESYLLQSSTEPPKVKPNPEPGYIYLFTEDDLVHFACRLRSKPLDEPDLDLVMIEQDGTFKPYEPTNAPNVSTRPPTNGRIYVLKFSSSSTKYFFWLQSRSQHESGNPSYFSARDRKLGQIVNTLLQGEEIDVQAEMENLPADQGGDDDETMEDVEGHGHSDEHHQGGSGGAGPGATGGDIREEGQESREGGADGGRA
jgi:26S proteasome regulatory subunit N13